jgi:flagellar hook-length control protein FliK
VPGPRGADATGDTVRISADRATATAGAAERVGEAAPAATTLPMPGAAALGATAAPGLAMAPPPDAPLPSFPVTVPVPDPRFPDALGERVTWMVREGIQGAELTLHPQELGPIRIELSLDGAAASIGVIAANAETRSAIEQALPRLREMLAGQGLHLGGAAVDAGSARQGQPDARGRTGRSEARDTFTSAIGVGGGPEVAVQASRPRRAGGIDVFA